MTNPVPLPEHAFAEPATENWAGVFRPGRSAYTADQMHAYAAAQSAADNAELRAENAALQERLLKMSDTMKGMDAHEAGLAEAQVYLMARVKVLEKALRDTIDTMQSVSIFVVSKERIKRPEGDEWYAEKIDAARAALGDKP